MNKRFMILPLALVSLLSVSVVSSLGANILKADETIYHVDFYDNYLRQEFTLSSGFKGTGNNLLYTTVDVTANSLVTKPENPTRKYYDFEGWYKEKECLNAWDFGSEVVTGNTRLYANWTFVKPEEITEPTYTPPSTVLEESADHDYEFYSLMSFKINKASSPYTLDLTTAALNKLAAAAQADAAAEAGQKTNVLSLAEYKVKASKTLTMTYADSYLTITCGEDVTSVLVRDASADYKVATVDYETKAVNYEKKLSQENENYHVVLAGSSSIEYWETSKTDLEPIVSYNHGIGGTVIQEWTEKLNQRLVYPYKPKMVVYYVGINNVINTSQSTEEICAALEEFFDSTHENLPNTKVQYILMNLLPGFKNKTEIINTINASAKEYQAKDNNSSWLTLINPGEALLKENNEPNAAYFRTDGLHLSNYGYGIWGGIVKESILTVLENM